MKPRHFCLRFRDLEIWYTRVPNLSMSYYFTKQKGLGLAIR